MKNSNGDALPGGAPVYRLAGSGGPCFISRNSMTSELTDLLRRRVAIIADHAWRDRNAAPQRHPALDKRFASA